MKQPTKPLRKVFVGPESQIAALRMVQQERDFQDKKWPKELPLPNEIWFRLLTEEYLELTRELNDHGTKNRTGSELVQVAALCVAWLEQMVKEEFNGPDHSNPS